MDYKLEDLIDIPFIQDLLDKLNEIYPFPSAIIDNDGKILTATSWQPICTKFHRVNPTSEIECIASDKYILDHIAEANPAVSYRCPHGMIDNAIPIIINGSHLANFFTGQFFLQSPNLDLFRQQAKKYGFDENAYLEAVRQTPVWDEDQLNKYLAFIQPFVNSLAETGLSRLQDIEKNKILQDSELRYRDLFETAPVMYLIAGEVNGILVITDCNQKFLDTTGYPRSEVLGKAITDFYSTASQTDFLEIDGYQRTISGGSLAEEVTLICKDGSHLACLVWSQPENGPGGKVIGLRTTYMDINLRKQTEQALQDSELRYAATMDALGDGIHVVDEDLTIQLCNASMSKWMQELGYSGILVGKNIFKAFPFLPEKVREEYQQVFLGRKTLITEEISQAGGREIQTETRKIPVIENGRVERIVTVVRDISERKRADQQLMLSESELKKAQSYAHVGSWIWNIKNGHLQWSDEMYNLFGISRENFSGNLEQVVSKAIHPDDREKVERSNLLVMNEGKPIPLEYRILLPDGSERVVWAEAGELERDEHGDPSLLRGIVMDITPIKQIEHELHENLINLQAVLDGIQEAILLVEGDGTIIAANKMMAKRLGKNAGDLVGTRIFDLSGEPVSQKRKKYMDQVISSGQQVQFEDERAGHFFENTIYPIFNEKGNVTRLAIFGQDITDHKQAEQRLETERNFATQVMNSMGQGLTVTDEHGCFEYVNSAYAHMLGCEPEELLGKLPEEFTWPDDVGVLNEAGTHRTQGQTTTYETRLKHKDGHAVHVMITGVPRWRAGQVFGAIAVITDLTDRKQAEEALRKSESQYRQQVNELQTIMDTIPMALWVAMDPMCNVIKGNRAAYELHQLPMGSNASFTSAEGQQIIHSKVFHNGEEIAGSELPLQLSASKGIEILDFDGEIVFDDGRVLYEIGNVKPLFDEDGKPRGAVGAFINITERKQAENEVSKRAKELDALQKTVLDITASQNVPGLLESIVARACQLVGAPCGAMYLSDSKKQEVNCVVSYNTGSDYKGMVLKFGEGVAGKIAQTGQSMNIPNYQTWAGRSQIFEQEKPFSAILGVPLIWSGQVSGVIDLMYFDEGSSFKQDDLEVLNLFAGHAAIAIENTRLLQEAISRNEEVRQLSIRLEEAEENERRRIARELHDQVGQSLSALSINLNIMHSQMPEYLPGFKRRLEDSLMLIDQTTDNIRSLMSELRPAVLDDYGLKAALDWAATAIARRTELKVLVEGECNRFEPRVEIALFRIAQEALANVSRHAHAKNVKIQLDQNGPDFFMSIADDGIGLGTTLSLEGKTGGMGLRLMRERAEAIGGSLQIESNHVQGTRITVKYHDQDFAG